MTKPAASAPPHAVSQASSRSGEAAAALLAEKLSEAKAPAAVAHARSAVAPSKNRNSSKTRRKTKAEARDDVADKIELCETFGAECREAAEAAGLVYVNDDQPGISRKKAGKGWTFSGPDGRTIKDHWERRRIEKIGVPPAYTDVWICPDPNGHIQATGRDIRGRKQYRYHEAWTRSRDSAKFDHMLHFGTLLPVLRKRVAADMRKHGLPREKVLATLVALLELTLIRVGNEDYAKENKSYGLTTLRNRHLDVEGAHMRFDFKGKSGKTWSLDIRDKRIAKVVRSIQELPGQHLFQYLDDEGHRHLVDSADVNAYLREATEEDITAKDFRTWAGTVLAAMALAEIEVVDSQSKMKKNVKAAVDSVAKRLGNTPTICRKCYIHPEIVATYLDGQLAAEIAKPVAAALRAGADELSGEELALLGLLSRRAKQATRPDASG